MKAGQRTRQTADGGRTLYLLDEPTTGLHFGGCKQAAGVIHRLTDFGKFRGDHRHNLDVIRNADWIIDLGPEGGEDGGRLVVQELRSWFRKIEIIHWSGSVGLSHKARSE